MGKRVYLPVKNPLTAVDGRSRGGFTLLEVLITLAIISIVAAIGIPAYTKFIQRARESAAITYLSKARKAQNVFLLENQQGYTGDFELLETTGIIQPGSGNPSRVVQDYRFDLTAGINASGEPVWNMTSSPTSGYKPSKWFYTDDTGVIRFEVDAPATSSSPPL